MNKIFRAIRLIIVNIRLLLKNKKRLSMVGLCRIEKDADIYISKNSKMIIGKNLCAENSVHVSACNGGVLSIGDGVFFNRNCIVVCQKDVSIGDNTIFGPNVCIYDHDHAFGEEGVTNEFSLGKVKIGNNCWFGAGSIVLKNTVIGDGCIIGAGTVVKGIVPSHSVVKNNRVLEIVSIENRGNAYE